MNTKIAELRAEIRRREGLRDAIDTATDAGKLQRQRASSYVSTLRARVRCWHDTAERLEKAGMQWSATYQLYVSACGKFCDHRGKFRVPGRDGRISAASREHSPVRVFVDAWPEWQDNATARLTHERLSREFASTADIRREQKRTSYHRTKGSTPKATKAATDAKRRRAAHVRKIMAARADLYSEGRTA